MLRQLRTLLSVLTLWAIALLVLSSSASAQQVFLGASPDPVDDSGQINYVATVLNDSAGALTGVVLTMIVPPDVLTFSDENIDGTCPGGSCSSGEIVTFALGVLPAGKSKSVLLPVELDGFVGTSTISNTVTVNHDGGGAFDTREVAVTSSHDLVLGLAGGPNPAGSGELLEYVLTFANTSGSLISSVELDLPLPGDTSFVDASHAGSEQGGSVVWDLGDLPPGSSGRRTALLAGGAAPELYGAVGSISGDGGAALASASLALALQSNSALDVYLGAKPDPVDDSGQVNYVATILNRGTTSLTGVEVRFIIPPDALSFSDENILGTCPGGGCSSGETAIFLLGTLPAGESRNILIPVELDGFVTDPLSGSTISVAHDAGSGTSASTVSLIEITPDLALALSGTPSSPIPAAESLNYVLSFANTSGSLLSGVTLEVPLPRGTSFGAASHAGSFLDGSIVWALGDLAAGASGQRTLSLIPEFSPFLIVMQADASAAGGSGARATQASTTQTTTPLAIDLVSTPDPVDDSGQVNYVATVLNRGTTSLTGVEARFIVPPDALTFSDENILGTCPGGSCSSGEVATLPVGTLPAGESRSFLIPVELDGFVTDAVLGSYAQATFNGGGGSVASTDVLIDNAPDLTLGLAASPDPASGTPLTYALLFANDSGSALSNVTLRLTVSGSVSAIFLDGFETGDTSRWSGSSRQQQQRILSEDFFWDLGSLAAGEIGERNVELSSEYTGLIAAEAVIAGTQTSAARGSYGATTRTIPSLGVSLSASPDPVDDGGQINYVAVVTNHGSVVLTGIEARIAIPSDVLTFSDSNISGTCPGGSCSSGEVATFAVGSLSPGQDQILLLPVELDGFVADRLIGSTVVASESGGGSAKATVFVRVQ